VFHAQREGGRTVLSGRRLLRMGGGGEEKKARAIFGGTRKEAHKKRGENDARVLTGRDRKGCKGIAAACQ